jgi:hypothetical protein
MPLDDVHQKPQSDMAMDTHWARSHTRPLQDWSDDRVFHRKVLEQLKGPPFPSVLICLLAAVLLKLFGFNACFGGLRLRKLSNFVRDDKNVVTEEQIQIVEEPCTPLDEPALDTEVHDIEPQLWRYMTSLPCCRCAEEMEQLMPETSGYDCAFTRPTSSRRPLRLDAVVTSSAAQSLISPFTEKECYAYLVSVTQSVHGAEPSVSVASAASASFSVVLADAPEVQIDICGDDVTLLMTGSTRRCSTQHMPGSAPKAWQDITLADSDLNQQRVIPKASLLDFQESILCIGDAVSLIGELHRSATGGLSLRPWPELIEEVPDAGASGAGEQDEGVGGLLCGTGEAPDVNWADSIWKGSPKVLVTDSQELRQCHDSSC